MASIFQVNHKIIIVLEVDFQVCVCVCLFFLYFSSCLSFLCAPPSPWLCSLQLILPLSWNRTAESLREQVAAMGTWGVLLTWADCTPVRAVVATAKKTVLGAGRLDSVTDFAITAAVMIKVNTYGILCMGRPSPMDILIYSNLRCTCLILKLLLTVTVGVININHIQVYLLQELILFFTLLLFFPSWIAPWPWYASISFPTKWG